MNKRSLLLVFAFLLALLPANAVLKEENLESTLSILRTELTNYHAELDRQSGYLRDQQTAIRDKLFSIMGQSNQNALMLYSQKPEYVFDLAYACHEATEQYADFQQNVQPFRSLSVCLIFTANVKHTLLSICAFLLSVLTFIVLSEFIK